MKPYRQGDVLLVPITAETLAAIKGAARRDPSRTVKRRKGQGIILASGEATGHHHRVRHPHARRVRVGHVDYLTVPGGGAEVTHEEHDPLYLPEGGYEIVRQREHIPAQRGNVGASRVVWD